MNYGVQMKTSYNKFYENASRKQKIFDFLSFVELYGNPTLFIICLNSVSNLKKALPYFERTKRIYLCLDNDETGHKTVADISATYPDKVIDKSGHYSPFKDFNEYLMNTKNGNQDKE